MFKRPFRIAKSRKHPKRDDAKTKMSDHCGHSSDTHSESSSVTIVAGPNHRLFAADEGTLSRSPVLASLIVGLNNKRLVLTDEEPETLSAVLEYLYTGDYSPGRLLFDKKHKAWMILEDGGHATMHSHGVGDILLDTAVYCAAERYGLDDLKRLALRKQGLRRGLDVATVLRSARYAYDHTDADESRLRAHYLALIISSRSTFSKSGTLQKMMEQGGTPLFFDLFVALSNFLDETIEANESAQRSPRLM